LKELVTDLKQAIIERNFPASRHLLEHARRGDKMASIADLLEEEYEESQYHTLELRDHVTSYLGIWDVYFAVQLTSIQMLRLLAENKSADAVVFMLDYTRSLLERGDPLFDQFFVSVETISKGPFAVLLPAILTKRSEELENCIIYYRTGENPLYCTANLLRTYYGRKIVSAILDDKVFNSVVSEKVFMKIEESLVSAGMDPSKMLVSVSPKDWEDTLCVLNIIDAPHEESKELGTLHRVYNARSDLFLESFRKQVAALETIQSAKTQLCNDVLMTVASSPGHEMQLRALKVLGESGDSSTLEFLSRMIRIEDPSVRNVAARAFSTLSSHIKLSSVGRAISPMEKQRPLLDISKVNRILNTLLSKDMPHEMIEDTLVAIATQGGKDAASVLIQLLSKPELSVQLAVVKASRFLDRDNAAQIIRTALKSDEPVLVDLAEKEINERWSDEVWK
jgi:hypothetical protein